MADRSARLPMSCRWALCTMLMTFGAMAILGEWVSGSDLRETPIVKAQRAARPSVVNIRGEKTITTTASQSGHNEPGRRVNGMGTGIVIDPRGYILTNHHVVDGVREIQVTLDGGAKYTAKLVARHAETDLAIVKIDPPEGQELPVIRLGTSSDLMPGETVVALGNAYGYEHTVTRGIVSALHRAVQVSDAQFYDDLIQTDASINPGNSGGPLLNIDGDMVGINVAVRAGAQGIGFAIPVDKAMAVAAELMALAGQRLHAHGITVAKEAPASGKGVVVAAVEKDSPAEKAGIKAGDVLTKVGKTEMERPLDFYRAVVEAAPGQQLDLVAQRGDEKVSSSVTFAAADPLWGVVGLKLKPIPAEEFREQNSKFSKEYRGGLQIVAVRPQSPAEERGLRQGDFLVGMHIWETISLENVTYIMNRTDFESFSPIEFRIIRNNRVFFGNLPINVPQARTARK